MHRASFLFHCKCGRQEDIQIYSSNDCVTKYHTCAGSYVLAILTRYMYYPRHLENVYIVVHVIITSLFTIIINNFNKIIINRVFYLLDARRVIIQPQATYIHNSNRCVASRTSCVLIKEVSQQLKIEKIKLGITQHTIMSSSHEWIFLR